MISDKSCRAIVQDRLKESSPIASVKDVDMPKFGVDISSLLLVADPARCLGKNYHIIEQVGQGGFGTVFRAKNVLADEERAVKQVLKTGLPDDMKYVYTELEAMVKLDHPNVVKLYEFYEDDRMMYLITELCTGGDFSDLNHGIDHPEEIRLLLRDMFMALAYCHDLGIAHRDMKFENCLITKQAEQRRVGKVIDFGLSAIRHKDDHHDTWLSDQLGSQYFVAPEVIDQSVQYGCECDLWSTGVMLYIINTDEHPCVTDAMSLDTKRFFRQVLRNNVRMDPLTNGDIDPTVSDLILKLLVKNPRHRLRAHQALSHSYFAGADGSGNRRRSSWKSFSAKPRGGSIANFDCSMASQLHAFGGFSRFERAVMTLAAHHACAREVDDVRAMFIELDTSRTGSLSKAEIREALNKCGHQMTEKDLEQLFDALDANGSGSVQYTEWLAATLKPSTLESDKAFSQVYNFFDHDSNGHISKEELMRVLGDQANVEKVLELGDVNGDGSISKAEFKALLDNVARSISKKRSAASGGSILRV